MNNIILTGRITRDLELKYGQSGAAYLKFTLAVERPFSRDETDFINCTVFNKLAELMHKYLRKGNKIGVIGALQMSRYEIKGEKRVSYEVAVNTVEFLENKEKSKSRTSDVSASTSSPKVNRVKSYDNEDAADEFPF